MSRVLNGIFWGLSAAATALLFIGVPSLSPWWIPLLLIGFYAAVAIVYLLTVLLASLFFPTAVPQPHSAVCRRLILLTEEWLITLLRLRIRFTGEEKLPQQPFLLVCNHLSNYDPIVTAVALKKRRLAFVSKPENFRIPAAGPFIRAASYLAIDRDHARKAVETIHRAADYIVERQMCMGIYPEGTRSKTGDLLPFRSGAFKIAKLAHCPVAVLSISYGKRPWLLGKKPVDLHVLEVFDTATVGAMQTGDLAERTRELITADQQK